VNRIQKTLILLTVIAVPAAAHSMFAPKQSQCFASGAATYQIASGAPSPDFRIRIESDAARPDLRMRLVDRAELADFVLVDDFSGQEPAPCRSSTPIQTVALSSGDTPADVTVKLTADTGAADYKIYVHSVRYSQQDAAALLAAMWMADRRRDTTASIARR
jgi:hypothetical protein